MANRLTIRRVVRTLWEGILEVLRTLKAADFSSERKHYTYAIYVIASLTLALVLAILFHLMPAIFGLLTVLHLSGVAAYAFLVLVSFMGFLGHGLVVSGKVALFGDDKAKKSFRDLLVPYLKIAIGGIMMMPFVILFHTKLMLPFFKISSQWLLIPIAMLMPILLGGPFFLLSMLCRVLASKMDRMTWYGHALFTIFNLLSKVFLFAAALCTLVFSMSPHILAEGFRSFMAYTAGPFYGGTQSLSLWPTIYTGMAKFVGIVCLLVPPLRYAGMVWTGKDQPVSEGVGGESPPLTPVRPRPCTEYHASPEIAATPVPQKAPLTFDSSEAVGTMKTDLEAKIDAAEMAVKQLGVLAQASSFSVNHLKSSIDHAEQEVGEMVTAFASLYGARVGPEHKDSHKNTVQSFHQKVKALQERFDKAWRAAEDLLHPKQGLQSP